MKHTILLLALCLSLQRSENCKNRTKKLLYTSADCDGPREITLIVDPWRPVLRFARLYNACSYSYWIFYRVRDRMEIEYWSFILMHWYVLYSNTTAKRRKNRRHYIIRYGSGSNSILMHSKVLLYFAFCCVYPLPRCSVRNRTERLKQNSVEIDSKNPTREHKSNENLYACGMCLYLMLSAMRI